MAAPILRKYYEHYEMLLAAAILRNTLEPFLEKRPVCTLEAFLSKSWEPDILAYGFQLHNVGHFQAIQIAHILLNINMVCIIRITLFPSCVLIFDHLISINKMAANFTMLATFRLFKEQTFFLTEIRYD